MTTTAPGHVRIDAREVLRTDAALKALFTGVQQATLARAIETALRSSLRTAFEHAIDPRTGAPWAPRITPVPWAPLQRTGAMRDAINVAVKRGRVNIWGKQFLLSGAHEPALRANVHLHGRHRWRPLPARPMIGLSPQAEAGIISLAERLVDQAVAT